MKLASTLSKFGRAEVGRNKDEWPGRTEEIIPTISRELGDRVDLLIDANSCYTVDRAIEIGKLLQDNGFSHLKNLPLLGARAN